MEPKKNDLCFHDTACKSVVFTCHCKPNSFAAYTFPVNYECPNPDCDWVCRGNCWCCPSGKLGYDELPFNLGPWLRKHLQELAKKYVQ